MQVKFSFEYVNTCTEFIFFGGSDLYIPYTIACIIRTEFVSMRVCTYITYIISSQMKNVCSQPPFATVNTEARLNICFWVWVGVAGYRDDQKPELFHFFM